MKVNQISAILNNVYGEIIGDTALIAEDLSNIVDVGKTIIASTQWGDNFDKYVGKIIDKVGRVIFVDRSYSGDDLGLSREGWEYGSIMEKVRVEVGDFTDNKAWQLADPTKPDFSGIFDFDSPADVEAKYFNQKTTFRLTICLPRNQMEGAFRSASDMMRFISAIENRIRFKMELAREALAYRTEANFIVEKIAANNGVVNLLTEYKQESGDTTLTAAHARESIEFLRYCVRRFKTDKALLARASGMYNTTGYTTFTPASRLKVFALTDFATAVETVLRSNTYHDDFVTLGGYREVPYWQGRGTADSFAVRSTLNAIPASKGSEGEAVNQSGIVFVMQDADACMIAQEQLPVESIYNPEGRFYKYWYMHEASYYNDLSENGIVYIIAD